MADKIEGNSRGKASKSSTQKRTAKTPEFICGSCGSHLVAPAGATGKEAGPLRLHAFLATADSASGKFITILATPKDAASWLVKLDGDQIALTAGQPHTQLISSGSHTMTAELHGDPGATLTATGTVSGKQVVECDCAILENSKDCADPEDFTVA